jgi:hypothetical protein
MGDLLLVDTSRHQVERPTGFRASSLRSCRSETISSVDALHGVRGATRQSSLWPCPKPFCP